jgi:hypothetical protein
MSTIVAKRAEERLFTLLVDVVLLPPGVELGETLVGINNIILLMDQC